ncbi:hypothetical protein AB4508_09040 [Vibrio splendidus]
MEPEPSKKISVRDFLLVTVSSVITAYLSVVIFGHDIEQKKSKLELQKSFFNSQFSIVSDLAEKAGVLHNQSALYRQYDLIKSEFNLPEQAVEMAKGTEPSSVNRAVIIKSQMEFQAVLFKSKPFIPDQVFESFAQYSSNINHFIHTSDAVNGSLKEDYQNASRSYAEGIELIKEMYSEQLKEAS